MFIYITRTRTLTTRLVIAIGSRLSLCDKCKSYFNSIFMYKRISSRMLSNISIAAHLICISWYLINKSDCAPIGGWTDLWDPLGLTNFWVCSAEFPFSWALTDQVICRQPVYTIELKFGATPHDETPQVQFSFVQATRTEKNISRLNSN